MGLSPLLLLPFLCPQAPSPAVPVPAAAVRPRAAPALLVLAPPDQPAWTAFQLGDGGIDRPAGTPPAPRPGVATTPGGVVVEARAEGVKLTFPGGRELLFTPTGFLHLRDESQGGGFESGAELLLADGCAVRIVRGATRRQPIEEVVLAIEDREDRLWGSGRALLERKRARPWTGPRLLCAGDGGAVYRAMALGPLVVCARVVAPQDQLERLPPHRLALFTAPLAQSLQVYAARRRGTTPELQQALTAIGDLAVASPRLFAVPDDRPPQVGKVEPCWALGSGCLLRLHADANAPVRLSLHLGDGGTPLCEWLLGLRSELKLLNPVQDGRPESPRYVLGGIDLPVSSPALQVRPEGGELAQAVELLRAALR